MNLGYFFDVALKKKKVHGKTPRGLYNIFAQRAFESKTIKRKRTHCPEVKRIK